MHSDLPLKFRRPIERPLGSPDTSAEFRSRTKCAFCVFFRAELPVDAVRSASSAGSRAYLRLGELGERHWLVFGQGCTSWRSYLVVLLDLRCFSRPDDCRASRNRVDGIVCGRKVNVRNAERDYPSIFVLPGCATSSFFPRSRPMFFVRQRADGLP